MPSAIATPADVDDIHTATRQANINRCMFSLSSDHRPRFSIDGPLGGDAVKVSKCLHDLPVDPRHRKPLPCSHPHIRARSAHRRISAVFDVCNPNRPILMMSMSLLVVQEAFHYLQVRTSR